MILSCPLHGNSDQAFFAKRSGFTLNICSKCGIVYIADDCDDIALNFYNDTKLGVKSKDAIEYWSVPSNYQKYRNIFTRFFSERMKRLMSAHNRIESLLDIGCGYGFFLDYAKQFVPSVMGIELNPDIVEQAQKDGRSVYCISAESLLMEKSYDCITLCDVLEHVENPLKMLETCYNLLNPDGILYVQVPNLLGFKLPFGHSWGLPHHLWQFGRKSLELLLHEAAFTNVSHRTGVLGVIGVYESGGPTLRNRLEWWFANFLGCGNRLQTLAIK